MADQSVEYILKARDQASDVVAKLSGRFMSLDAAISKMGMSVSAIGIAGGLAAIATGANAAARSYADFAETLDRESRTAGTSAQNMQALRRAFEAAGLSGDDAAGAIAKLNKAIDEGNPYLREMGVNGRDAFDAFMQIGATLGTVTDEAHKTKVVSDLMGRSMAENSAIITDLADSTREIAGVYQQFGGQMDDLAMVRAKRLDQSFDDLDTRLDATSKALSKHFTPSLVGALEGTNNLIDGFVRMIAPLEAIEEKLKTGRLAKLLTLLAAPGGMLLAPLLAGASAIGAAGPQLGMLPAHGPGYVPRPEESVVVPRFPQYGTEGNHLGLRGTADAQAEAAERAHKSLEKIVSILKEVPVVELQYTELGRHMREVSDTIEASTDRMKTLVASDIASAVDQFIYASGTFREVWHSLMQSILSDLAATAAKLGVGLGLELLGFAVGGPAGAVIATVGERVASGHAMAPGGDTYYISTLNAKDLIDDLVSPTGQMRQANDRIRDVARAGAL